MNKIRFLRWSIFSLIHTKYFRKDVSQSFQAWSVFKSCRLWAVCTPYMSHTIHTGAVEHTNLLPHVVPGTKNGVQIRQDVPCLLPYRINPSHFRLLHTPEDASSAIRPLKRPAPHCSVQPAIPSRSPPSPALHDGPSPASRFAFGVTSAR